jgi:RNA recognition motif-containing protein
MKTEWFVANLPQDITKEQLRDVFAAWGDVAQVMLLVEDDPIAVTGAARVTLETELAVDDLLTQANGQRVDGKWWAVSPAYPRRGVPPLTAEQRPEAKRIAETLGETTALAYGLLARLIRHCGVAFAQALLEEALAVEAAGGMLTLDGSRHRTPGGTYFRLARERLRAPVAQAILRPRHRKPKPPPTPPEPAEAALAEQSDGVGETDAEPAPEEGAARDPVDELRQALQAAEERLAAIRTGQAQGSLVGAMKEVVILQQQIDHLLAAHPERDEWAGGSSA